MTLSEVKPGDVIKFEKIDKPGLVTFRAISFTEVWFEDVGERTFRDDTVEVIHVGRGERVTVLRML